MVTLLPEMLWHIASKALLLLKLEAQLLSFA